MSRRPNKPTSIASPAVPGSRTHLVLVREDLARSGATLLPIAVGSPAPRALTPREVDEVMPPARSWPSQPGGVQVLTAHDGGTRAVVVVAAGAAIRAEVIALDGGPSRSISLERAPSSLLLQGRALLLGEAGRVSFLDLDGDASERPVVGREAEGKAYHILARDGDLAIAIDDVAWPYRGDSIRLGPVPVQVAAFDMPTLINGSYQLAAFAGAGGDAGTLYTVAPFDVMSGSGQYVAAIPVAGGRVEVHSPPLLGAQPFPVLEEFVPRGTGPTTALIAGDRMTPFTGLAVARRDDVPFRVALAAGERGLLALPSDFQRGTRAEVLDLGEPCTDVLADGDRLWALAGATLIELSASLGRLEPIRSTALPSRYGAFAH